MDDMTFDRVADIYDATRALPREVMSAVLETMKDALSGCVTIIDVGVGTGRFAAPLQALGFEVVGVDLAGGMMKKAREKGVRNLFTADARQIPFRDGAFDAATVVHVMQLVQPWQRVAGEIGRVSRRKVVSVIEHVEGNGRRLSTEYSKARAELGRPLKRLEGAEEALMERVEPSAVIEATRYTEDEVADEEISYLEKRGSSRTWGLEEHVHMQIITGLRSKYSGEKWQREHIVSVVVWNPANLAAQAGT